MADATTTNRGYAKPTVGGDDDTWGQTQNATVDAIDADMQNALNLGAAALPKAGGTLTGHVAFSPGNGLTFDPETPPNGQGAGVVPHFGDGGNGSGVITVSTAAASGTPGNGDLWIQHT